MHTIHLSVSEVYFISSHSITGLPCHHLTLSMCSDRVCRSHVLQELLGQLQMWLV